MSRLLVTTCTPPEEGVYLLDTRSGETLRLHNRTTRGITRAPGGFYFVEHLGRVCRLEPGLWTVTPVLDTGLVGCHDLKWTGEEFYLVSSYGNRVSRYDAAFQPIDSMQIVEDEGDVCHPNSLLAVNGRLLLSIFTLSPGRREEKRHQEAWRREGKVLQLDWARKTYEILFEPLAQPHSLTWRDGTLYCCESLTSYLTALSLEQQQRRQVCRLHGFVRGLAFEGETAFVGISKEKRKQPLPWWRRLGAPRPECGVIELDARTWRLRRAFAIPGSEVYDLMLADAPG